MPQPFTATAHHSAFGSTVSVSLAAGVDISLCRRTSSQKPNDDLYNEFKASFPLLAGRSSHDISGTSAGHLEQSHVSEALDVALNPRYVRSLVPLPPPPSPLLIGQAAMRQKRNMAA